MAKNNDEKMIGNKGEWTELYVFLKLLAQGEVQGVDEKMEKVQNLCYPVVQIMREEHKGERIDYMIDKNEVIVKVQSREIMRINRSEIDKQADCLFDEIKKNKGNNFELLEMEKFVNGMQVTRIKAPSETKNDIFMQICDDPTQPSTDLGFSIKSYMGNPPTLLNPSQATNFVYKVEGLNREQADEINGIGGESPISGRMAKIRDYGGKLSFFEMFDETFKRNLTMIDSDMPKIIADVLLDFYNNKGSGNVGIKRCKVLIERMGDCDSLQYEDVTMYESKFKKFLCACALGMKPKTLWDGLDEVNGGYINVKSDGEILAYRIYNRNSFEQYLLDNTELETAIIKKTERHNYDYLKLYMENGEMFIKLNLQVRFKKM